MAIVPAKSNADYTFKVGSYSADKLKVTKFVGTEGISQLYRFSVDLASHDGEVNFDNVLGQPALLTLHAPKDKRYVHGIVNCFEQMPRQGRWVQYHADIAPAAWTLSCRVNCRIFQDLAIPDIIKQILVDGGISSDQFRFSLKNSYAPREYCVQYRESDFAFISRLMEQYGLFYFFEHQTDKHVMVIGDDVVNHVSIADPAKVVYHAPTTTGVSNQEHVYDFRYTREVRSSSVTLRDFDFKKPRLDLQTSEGDSRLEVYDYPGAYLKPEEGKDVARIRLEELRATRQVAFGKSDCGRLIPGYRFTLDRSERADFDREYVLIQVSHSGTQPQTFGADGAGRGGDEALYQNQFECIPSDVSFRPARLTPRPVIQGPQTAIVVGPKGEEIYVDAHGRVKVQFHWDREGEMNEKSSCWIRVSQTWAGSRWGAMVPPRIGQEVVVQFCEGDPDQPIITGSVYNGDNKPPYELPGEKTKSTLKSNSSKGGEGFNEIRFEDKKGQEQLFFHAERNYDIRVKNDTFEWVGNDRNSIVKKDQITKVEGDQHLTVVGDHNQKINGTISRQAGMDLQEKVGMKHALDAGMEIHFKAGMNVVVEAGMSITLKAGAGFIVVGPAGVTISGTPVLINSGGAAGSGSGASPDTPKEPKEADNAKSGEKSSAPAATSSVLKSASSSSSMQAAALKEAAKVGVPFCEKCEAAKAVQAG